MFYTDRRWAAGKDVHSVLPDVSIGIDTDCFEYVYYLTKFNPFYRRHG